jgi:hypothetical protein
MTSLCEALQGIVDPRRVLKGSVLLAESKQGSRCQSTLVKCSRSFWALRFEEQDYLRILAELSKDRSVRRLPDYLVFCEPERPPQSARDVALRVLVCELKSSPTGAESADVQVQLGKLMAEYLIGLALHHQRLTDKPHIYSSGLVVSPALPASVGPKGRMRPGKVDYHNEYDNLSAMRIYYAPDGGELHLENFF